MKKIIILSVAAIIIGTLFTLFTLNVFTAGAEDDYSQNINSSNALEAKLTFTPKVPVDYVILHYSINQGTSQNVYMNKVDANYEKNIYGLKKTDSIIYSFTYSKEGRQYESYRYCYYQDFNVPYTVEKTSTSQEKIHFKLVTAVPDSVVLHYTVDNGQQQNVNMDKNSDEYIYTLNNLNNGSSVRYSFTYCISGNQYEAQEASFVHSATDTDTLKPTAMNDLSGYFSSDSTGTQGVIILTWTKFTDNVGVKYYQLYDGDTLLVDNMIPGSPYRSNTQCQYLYNNYVLGKTYNFTVKAVDAAGNVSDPCNVATIAAVVK